MIITQVETCVSCFSLELLTKLSQLYAVYRVAIVVMYMGDTFIHLFVLVRIERYEKGKGYKCPF